MSSVCLIFLESSNHNNIYKCLIVSLVFSHLGFWSGNLFLIAPFPDLCLLVPFYAAAYYNYNTESQEILKITTSCPFHSQTVYVYNKISSAAGM